MATIFDLNGSERLAREEFVPRGRSTVENKERGRGGGVKILQIQT